LVEAVGGGKTGKKGRNAAYQRTVQKRGLNHLGDRNRGGGSNESCTKSSKMKTGVKRERKADWGGEK